jgi:hypothetical protein
MRALALFLGLLAGAACLAFLGVAQLIWAQSEASYYVQLTLAAVLIGGLFFVARKASTRAIGVAVVTIAFLAAFMPIENRLIAFSSISQRNAAEPRIGDEIGSAAGFTDQVTSIVLLWLIHTVLLAVFAFGVRYWLIRSGREAERT